MPGRAYLASDRIDACSPQTKGGGQLHGEQLGRWGEREVTINVTATTLRTPPAALGIAP